MNEKHEAQAKRLDEAAQELEAAMKHCQVAAKHFRTSEVPRGCAHTLAAEGHINVALDQIAELAKVHSRAARTE